MVSFIPLVIVTIQCICVHLWKIGHFSPNSPLSLPVLVQWQLSGGARIGSGEESREGYDTGIFFSQ